MVCFRPSKHPRTHLTPKQKRLLDFIGEFLGRNGYAPSQHEIAAHFGYSSLGTVQNFLVRLERGGHLRKEWNGKRAIEIPLREAPAPPNFPMRGSSSQAIRNHEVELPLLGRVAAGRPIEAVETRETIEVPPSMVREGTSGGFFVLQVSGDSMIDDGILDGDYVVIQKQEIADDGETVVALIDNEATIKRLRRRREGGRERVELHPANPNYAPIKVSPDREFRIEGVFAGLIRKPRE